VLGHLLREVLVLTKMNWNSANMFGLMPITLRSPAVASAAIEVPAAVATSDRSTSA
jgi:hypothetical protein